MPKIKQLVKLNEETIIKICDAISTGVPFDRACLLADISRTIFYRWKKRGESIIDGTNRTPFRKEDKILYKKFVTELAKAEAKCIQHHVMRIFNGEKNWQASSWFLERRYHDDWGNKDKMQMQIGGEINVSMTTMAKAFDKWQKEKEKGTTSNSLPNFMKV